MGFDELEIIDLESDELRDVDKPRSRRLWPLVGLALAALLVGAIAIRSIHSAHRARRASSTSTTATTLPGAATDPVPVRTAASVASPLSVRAPDGWQFGAVLDVDGFIWVQTSPEKCQWPCETHWWRIDPRSGAAQQLRIPSYVDDEDFFAGLGSIWTLRYLLDNQPFTLSRINPSTGRVAAQTQLRETGRIGGTNPQDHLVAADGSVWVNANDKLIRLDPTTLRETARIDIPGLNGMVVDHSVLWAIDYGNGGLWRVDPHTGKAKHVVNACCFSQSIAADGRYIWFTHATQHGEVDLVRVSETLPYQAVSTHIPTAHVVASSGSVWFLGTYMRAASTADPGLVARVDPETLAATPIANLHLKTDPYPNAGLIVVDGVPWVVDANRTLIRVGSLH